MPVTPPVSNALPSRFRLGDWIVDSAIGELVGADETVPLTGLSLALLLSLAKRSGQLSDTDSLIAEVWGRESVSDATLQQRVKLLRRALRDDSETPRYISTIRGRGYRLLLQVQALDEALPEAALETLPASVTASTPSATVSAPSSARRRQTWRWAGLALMLLLLAGAAWFYWQGRAQANGQFAARRLVVLPMTLASLASDDELLADGLTEQLIWSLSRVQGLEVIGRSSSMSYKKQLRPLPEMAAVLARELRVGSVLQGSIQRSGERLQITLTLTELSNLRTLWSKRFDATSDGLTAVQMQVAEQVAQLLGVAQNAPAALPIDGDGYTLYLQGRQHYLRYSAQENAIAMELFRASLARSPTYPPALAGLSDSYAQAVYQFGAPDNQLDDALRYAEAAVTLAPQLAEAQKARGLALDLLGRRREAAISYHLASELNPNYSDAMINEAILQWESGHLAEAYKLARRAISLDPLDPYAYLITAQVLTSAGFAPAAQAILEQVQKHAPDSAIAQTIRCAHWVELGQYERAEPECQALLKQHPDFAPGWTLSADLALFNGQRELAIARFSTAAGLGAGSDAFYARLRLAVMPGAAESAKLMPVLKELRHKIKQHDEDPDHQLQLAMLLAALGQVDQGITALEAAVQAGHSDRHWLQADPVLGPLRADARYAGVLARLDARLSSEQKKVQLLLEERDQQSTARPKN